jgi:hypothetical protein
MNCIAKIYDIFMSGVEEILMNEKVEGNGASQRMIWNVVVVFKYVNIE